MQTDLFIDTNFSEYS